MDEMPTSAALDPKPRWAGRQEDRFKPVCPRSPRKASVSSFVNEQAGQMFPKPLTALGSTGPRSWGQGAMRELCEHSSVISMHRALVNSAPGSLRFNHCGYLGTGESKGPLCPSSGGGSSNFFHCQQEVAVMGAGGIIIPCKGFLRIGSWGGKLRVRLVAPRVRCEQHRDSCQAPSLSPLPQEDTAQATCRFPDPRAKALQRNLGGHTTQCSTLFRCRKWVPTTFV